MHNAYGTPEDLKRLVEECHLRGIAVFLDMVYNHIGPEGNYIGQYGTYFTNQYCTPWGDALYFDGAWSDGVREFFANNAAFWATQYPWTACGWTPFTRCTIRAPCTSGSMLMKP